MEALVNGSSGPRRPWESKLAVVALVVAFSWVLAANLWPGSWGRALALTTWQGGPSQPSFDQIDALFLQRVPEGNIWLRFEGFGPADEGFVTAVYYRGNYIVHPRRVHVARPGTVINNGSAIFEPEPLPDPELARRLGIEWSVVFARGADGRVTVGVEPW